MCLKGGPKIWFCLSDAVLKMAYAHLNFPQIADSQGYAVTEAFLQVGSSNDDGSAKQLDLAIKLTRKNSTGRQRGVVQSMALVVGMAVVMAVVAGVALLVAGTTQAQGSAREKNRPKREWWPLLHARNGASWAPYVVAERCLNVNRQADVFLPGPGSANTIVVGAPK